MKYYEYGVRSYESKNIIGRFGEDVNKNWKHLMDRHSRLGLLGWENYQILEKNDVTHFFFRKEISKDQAEKTYSQKDIDTYPLGFVDHSTN